MVLSDEDVGYEEEEQLAIQPPVVPVRVPVYFKQPLHTYEISSDDLRNWFHCLVALEGLESKRYWVQGARTIAYLRDRVNLELEAEGRVTTGFSLPDGTDLPVDTALAVPLKANDGVICKVVGTHVAI